LVQVRRVVRARPVRSGRKGRGSSSPNAKLMAESVVEGTRVETGSKNGGGETWTGWGRYSIKKDTCL
jgi:hypothetical protein